MLNDTESTATESTTSRWRRYGAVLTAGLLALSLSACGDDGNGNGGDSVDDSGHEDVDTDIPDGEDEPQSEEFVAAKTHNFYQAVAEAEPIEDEDFEELDIEDTEAVTELFEEHFGDIIEEYVDTSDLDDEEEDMLFIYASIDDINQALYKAPSDWIHVSAAHTEVDGDSATVAITQGPAQVSQDYVTENYDDFEDFVESEYISEGTYDEGELSYIDGEWSVVLSAPEEQEQPEMSPEDLEDLEIEMEEAPEGAGDAEADLDEDADSDADDDADDSAADDDADADDESDDN